QLILRNACDVRGRPLDRAAHVAPGASRPGADLAGAHLDWRRHAVKAPGEFDQRAIALAAHALHQAPYASLKRRVGGKVGMENPGEGSEIARFNDPDSRWSTHNLQDDLIKWIFDDSLSARRLEPRDQIPDRALLDDGIHRHPLLVAQGRDRRALQRR